MSVVICSFTKGANKATHSIRDATALFIVKKLVVTVLGYD
jgi:hypothetical protein